MKDHMEITNWAGDNSPNDDCRNMEVRELLPDYIHRSLSDSQTMMVDAHLESCESCITELSILRMVGANANTSVPASWSLTAEERYERIESAVLPYAPMPPVSTPPTRYSHNTSARNFWMGIAAMLVVVLGVMAGPSVSDMISNDASLVADGSSAVQYEGVSLISTADLSEDELEELIDLTRTMEFFPDMNNGEFLDESILMDDYGFMY